MPKPLSNETKEEYISRCTKYVIDNEGVEQKQAVGKCYGLWDHFNKKDEMLLHKIDHYINENIDMTLAEYIQKCMEIIMKEEGTCTADIDVTPTNDKPKKKKKSMLRKRLQYHDTTV